MKLTFLFDLLNFLVFNLIIKSFTLKTGYFTAKIDTDDFFVACKIEITANVMYRALFQFVYYVS